MQRARSTSAVDEFIFSHSHSGMRCITIDGTRRNAGVEMNENVENRHPGRGQNDDDNRQNEAPTNDMHCGMCMVAKENGMDIFEKTYNLNGQWTSVQCGLCTRPLLPFRPLLAFFGNSFQECEWNLYYRRRPAFHLANAEQWGSTGGAKRQYTK